MIVSDMHITYTFFDTKKERFDEYINNISLFYTHTHVYIYVWLLVYDY